MIFPTNEYLAGCTEAPLKWTRAHRAQPHIASDVDLCEARDSVLRPLMLLAIRDSAAVLLPQAAEVLVQLLLPGDEAFGALV